MEAELLDGSGPERVAGAEDDAFYLLLTPIIIREFRYGRGLPDTVDSEDEEDREAVRGDFEESSFHEFPEPGAKDREDLFLGPEAVFLRLFLEGSDDFRGGRGPHVPPR